MHLLIHGLYITLQSLPSHLICYYPVRSHLRFSHRITVLAVSCCLLVQAVLYGLAANRYPLGVMVEYGFAPVFLLIYLLCVKADVFRLLFFYVFSASYTVASKGLTAFLIARLFPSSGLPVWPSLGLHLLVVLLTVPILLRSLNRTKDSILHTDAPLLWRTIWLAPCLTVFITLLFTWDLRDATAGTLPFLIARVAVPFSTMAVYLLLIQSLGSVQACAVAEEERQQRDRLLALQRTQFARLQRHIRQTRQARHDLRQHLNLIQAYLNRGEEQALTDYIAAYGRSLPLDSHTSFCENIAADTVIGYYAEEAEKNGIGFHCHADLPARLPISEPDLCALLGNLLENALEACARLPGGTAYIRLNILTEDAVIAITADNPCPAPPQEKEGRLISAKDGRFGVGTQSVRTVARHYGGSALFEWENGEFRASVLLKLPPPSEAP